MTNTMCIIKYKRCLLNKPSNGIMLKEKNINFRTQRFYPIHKLEKPKGIPLPQKHRYSQY